MAMVTLAQLGENPIVLEAHGFQKINETLLRFANSKADEALVLETNDKKRFRIIRKNGVLYIP